MLQKYCLSHDIINAHMSKKKFNEADNAFLGTISVVASFIVFCISLTHISALVALKCYFGNKRVILGTASMEINPLQQLILIALLEVIKILLFNLVIIWRSRDGKERFSELKITSKK